MKYTIHPDFEYAIHPDFESISRIPTFRTRLGISFVRHRYEGLFEYEHDIPGVKVRRLNISAESSPTFVRSVLYTPEVLKSNTKVLFCHGGVLVLPVLPYHYRFARITASELVCIVLMPDYHLAPEYRMIRVTSALTVTNILFQTAVMWLLPVTAQEAVSPP